MKKNNINITKYNKTISKFALDAIEILEKNNFEAWFIGGFVRNMLQNDVYKNCTDIDITTNAQPTQVKEIFKKAKWKYFNIGEKFGTITIIAPDEYKNFDDKQQKIEITSYRKETSYIDNRHPSKLEFCNSIDQDLSRRDFTINSIAYNPKNGFYDPYNGLKDLENKIITTVGTPRVRFEEDYLRILRAIRFCAQLGFNISKDTRAEILNLKEEINNISEERIRDELSKILCSKNCVYALEKYKDVIFEIIPKLQPLDGFDQKTKYHCHDIYKHTLVCIEKMPLDKYMTQVDFETSMLMNKIGRWAALLHDIGKPRCFSMGKNGQGHFFGHPKVSQEISKEILNNFKFSKKFINSVLLIIRWHDLPFNKIDKTIIKLYRIFRETNISVKPELLFKLYCDVRRADSYAHHPDYQEYVSYTNKIEKRFNHMIKKEQVFCIDDLNINGNNIIDLGIIPGKQVKDLLNKCLESVINEKIDNNLESLIFYIKSII